MGRDPHARAVAKDGVDMKVPTEHAEQCQLMTWCRLNAWKYPELKRLFAVPNGGLRNKVVAAQLQQEGVRPGVPDLCLPVPVGSYHGLYIEMKRRKGGTVTDNQKDWLEYLGGVGYATAVCRGWEEAKETLLEYIGEK